MPAGTDPLDQRLVQVAFDLLEGEGLDRLTLRRVARRAGVSHGAPLRHFTGLADLSAEVAARGFAMLSEAAEKSGPQLPPGSDPLERLHAAGRAYVETAVAHPDLFALMFRPEHIDFDNPRLARASADAFEQVVRHVRAAQDAGWQEAHDTRSLAGTVWASVHGLATLWSQGAVSGAVPGASLDDAIAITQELALGGRRGGSHE